MRSQFLFLPTGAALLVLTFAPFCQAAPSNSPSASVPALSQTIQGLTVRLTGFGWTFSEPPPRPPFAFSRIFFVSYSIQAVPLPVLPRGKGLVDFVTRVEAISPEGWSLDTHGSGRSRDSNGSANWESADPRWPLIALDIDVADPASSARDRGQYDGPLILKDIPVPSQVGTVTPVHAEAVTPLGTQVIMEKVRVATQGGTTFVFRAVPAPDAPDLQFRESTDSRAVDDLGKTLGKGSMAGNGDPLGHEAGANLFCVGVSGVPSPGARTMTLTLDVSEKSEQQRREAAIRHFHFSVPLRLAETSRRRPHPPLAVVAGKDVVVSLDSVTAVFKRDVVRLVLRDKADASVTWKLRALRGKTNSGEALTGRPSRYTGFYWKNDGAPLAPGEDSAEVYMGAPGNPNGPYGTADAPPAKMLSLEAEVAAVRERSHVLDFPNIPVPAPGQTLTLNRRAQDSFGDYLILRKVMSYSAAHPLPDGYPKPNNVFVAPSGLAVVLAEPPALAGRQRFDYELTAANDPQGRRLRPVDSLEIVRADALLGDASPPAEDRARVQTFLLRAPTSGAATFNLRMGRDETISLGKTETIVFPPVAAPPLAN